MPGLGGGEPRPDDFLAELAGWSAADRAARAASERMRTRDLVHQSAAGATWTGVLVDLAEAAAEVTVWLDSGSRLAGRLVGVARDFVVLDGRAGRPVLVRTAAINGLVPAAGAGAAAGSGGRPGGRVDGPHAVRDAAPVNRPGGRRQAALDLSLASALDALAAEESPVTLHSGADNVAGTLVACGEDVVTIRADGVGRRPVYVPLDRVTCVELR